MWDLPSAKSNRFVFSESWDVISLTLPILISVFAAPFLYAFVPNDTIPFWGYMLVVVFFDVAHVWSTLFRTHFDSNENRRRPLLYNIMPVALLILQTITHYLAGERLFWTVIGYLAIYHFVKQQYGMLMIAEVRERNFKDINRDKKFLYALALFPVFLWHCDSTRFFDWFNRDDEFLFTAFPRMMTETRFYVGELTLTPLFLVYVLWGILWAVFAATMIRDAHVCMSSKTPFPLVRTLLLFYSGVTWSVGVLYNHKMIALTFLNLFHAMPSFVIVFCASMNRWRFGDKVSKHSLGDRVGKFFTGSKKRFVYYLVLLFGLGSLEEALWEGLVWQDYVDTEWVGGWHADGGAGYSHPLLYSFVVSLLILPQTTHYFLDMYIWKMGKVHDGSEMNPKLKQFLALAPLSP